MIDDSGLYVIAVCSNPVRYKTRWELFRQFRRHISDLGGKLLVVEEAFGTRDFQVTSSDNSMDVQVRSSVELWRKENMINIGIRRLSQIDPNWLHVAWIDGDVHFERHDALTETVHQLQHYSVVQMFSHVVNLGPDREPLSIDKGFAFQYHQNGCLPGNPNQKYGKLGFWHPGFAWAATRDSIDRIQLFDKAILGAGDHHMALSIVGMAEKSLPPEISRGYKRAVLEWQDEATIAFNQNLGYVPGTITHSWHGSKKNRKYIERWKVLIDNAFDPYTDLFVDSYGLYGLKDDKKRLLRLRDQIRHYFRGRNEDSIDLDS